MKERKFTINVPNIKTAEFNRVSASLKRHLKRAFPDDPPAFSCPAKPKATLHLTVKPKHAKTALTHIAVWRARNPEIELFVDGKLHKIAGQTIKIRPPKATVSKVILRRVTDRQLIDKQGAPKRPRRLPDDDFALELTASSPTRLPDHEFIEEEYEGGPTAVEE